SAAGLLREPGLLRLRPFRAPHHTISGVGLVGGGPGPRAGEATLAHHGVLFLDELAEFGRATLDVLRQPLEEGSVLITRGNRAVRLPARFTLVAAMNPCPCGQLGRSDRPC
ncbi:MAG: ATP-dependent protease, partial [Acidobacteria bacterium]